MHLSSKWPRKSSFQDEQCEFDSRQVYHFELLLDDSKLINERMKICSICKTSKTTTEFNLKLKAHDGLQPACKSCSRLRSRVHYENNKSSYIKRNRSRNQSVRDWLRSYKESNPCKDCGKTYPYCVMDFDHLSNKSFSIGGKGYTKGLATLKKEMAKCELVCSNCHRLRTFNRLQNSGVV